MLKIRNNKNLSALILLIVVLIIPNKEFTSNVNTETPSYNLQAVNGNLLLDLVTNSSIISNNNGTLGTLNLLNNGSNIIQNINIDFSNNGNFSYITSKYDSHQEITSLSSGFGDSKNIEVILNTTEENLYTGSADVCLIFDASGSMINEIESFKSNFQNKITNIMKGNPSLRIGIIIYGWDKYSEYPYSNQNNFLELNSEIQNITNFVDTLNAAGGYEPWGDALHLANTMDWRENVDKLIVLVGDEDCDPGDFVGTNSYDDYYNGTELVDVVSSIEEKNIKINTILAKGYDSITENQFNWISEITNGQTIDLTDFGSEYEYLQLPNIIDSWIIALINEFNVELTADVSWEEDNGEGWELFTQQLVAKIKVDNSPPSISYDGTLDLKEDSSYSYKIIFTIADASPIVNKSIFTTFDNLSVVSSPNWTLQNYSVLNDGNRLYFEMENLSLGDNFSYLIFSSDTYGNEYQIDIQNLTIDISYISPNYSSSLFFEDNNTTQSIFMEFKNSNKGYLLIEKKQSILINIPNSNFSSVLVYSTGSIDIYEIQALSENQQFFVRFYGNWSGNNNVIRWVEENTISLGSLTSFVNSNKQNFFALVQLVDYESGKLVLNTENGNFIPQVYVFNETWTYVGTFSNTTSLELSKGKYYIWIIYDQISSEFKIKYNKITQPTTPPVFKSYPNISPYFGLGVTLLLILGILFSKQKKKSCGVSDE